MHDQSDAIVRVPSNEKEKLTWEEQSGFLEFLSTVPAEVSKFNESVEPVVKYEVAPPYAIDGQKEKATRIGFVVTARMGSFSGRAHCLYTLFEGQALMACLGYSEQGRIETRLELEPLEDFDEGQSALYDWLRALLKASSQDQ